MIRDIIDELLFWWRNGNIKCPSCNSLYRVDELVHEDNFGVTTTDGIVFDICFACRTGEHWFDEQAFAIQALKRNYSVQEVCEAIDLIQQDRFASHITQEMLRRRYACDTRL